MPELPEVEVVVRHLDSLVRGLRIQSVEVWREKIIRPHSPRELASKLTGRVFRRVTRRAKFLLFELSGAGAGGDSPIQLVGHLGMTGRIYLQSSDVPKARHAVVELNLGKSSLVFEDPRQFGRLHLDPAALDALGPEPLSEQFTPAILSDLLGRSQQPVKVRLMDPSVVVGVGNIYSSESLFEARISPFRPSQSLSPGEILRLWKSIRRVLGEAIARGSGISLDSAPEREQLFYHGKTSRAKEPADPDPLRVYGRDGRPCIRCGTVILRSCQSGRSTFYCPNCQPAEAAPGASRPVSNSGQHRTHGK